MYRFKQEDEQTINREHPYITLAPKAPIFVSGCYPELDPCKNNFEADSCCTINEKSRPYRKRHKFKLYSILFKTYAKGNRQDAKLESSAPGLRFYNLGKLG